MTVFGDYATYYDLLYRDKDYVAEADYVQGLIQRFRPDAKSILELGSGTGRHAALLAGKGYEVHGVERSEEMLKKARSQESGVRCQAGSRHQGTGDRAGGSVEFTQGDIRDVRVGRRFDVVMSLFHVISYQTSDEDLLAAFRTAREHLEPGGLFLFDFWYGPAVLTERPAVRVKRVADETVEIVRVAEPVLRSEENVVEVHYDMFVREKATDRIEEIRETHVMRYLFLPEIKSFLAQVGLDLVHAEEWVTARPPNPAAWGVLVAARALNENRCEDGGADE